MAGGPFNIQWYRTFAGAQQYQPIPFATEAIYVLNAEDVGAMVKAEAVGQDPAHVVSAEAGPVGLSRKNAERVEELMKKSEVEFAVRMPLRCC